MRDIKGLLSYDGTRDTEQNQDRVSLQSDGERIVESGRNYGDGPIW